MNRAAIFMLACAGATRAADISGRVFDPSGAVIPKAMVRVTNSETGAKSETTTGDDGSFRVQSLVAGTYEVRVGVPGFAYFYRGGIKLDANANFSLNPAMALGEVSETVIIEAPGKANPQPARPQRIRVGGNVQATRLLTQVKPEYPGKAKNDGKEGTVLMRAVISKEGKILGLRTLGDADPDLAAAAQDAVKQWTYEPTRLNGVAVEVVTVIEVRFRLAG
jgi:TonB family protein